MFNSLLNASSASIDSLVLDIFIILAVVLAGGLIVYFLWEMVSKIIANNKNAKGDDKLVFEQKDKKNVSVDGFSAFSLDAQKEEEIKPVSAEAEVEPKSVTEETEIVDVDENKAEEEKSQLEAQISEEERENAERRAYLEARRQEILRRMQENRESEQAEEQEESQPEETQTEIEPVEQIEDPTETVETQETEAEQQEVEAESTSNEDALEEERRALEEEKEKYATMVKELEEAKRALAEQKPQEPVVKTVVVNNKLAGLSIDELKSMLASAQERLKTTEKEFKQCKKEYIPLQKVWSTYEKDQKKLRRKEALVAKQKVLLYGVNNYADIDEEKAKKLSEDLDLLDGLKLSVQHCEEVMKNNEERYPLLERMYNVLKTRNDELKNDIAQLNEEIARLESEQQEVNGEANGETENQ